MLLDSDIKRPDDTITKVFDFSAFVAEVAPDEVSYILRGQSGPEYNEVSIVGGVITLQISGGVAGRHYIYGYEAQTANGESAVQTLRLRVVEPLFDALPEGNVIPLGGLSTEDGQLLFETSTLVLS